MSEKVCTTAVRVQKLRRSPPRVDRASVEYLRTVPSVSGLSASLTRGTSTCEVKIMRLLGSITLTNPAGRGPAPGERSQYPNKGRSMHASSPTPLLFV